jgi:DNA-binding MarR family transcriptional regulator
VTRPSTPTRGNLGYLLAKAAQRWNDLLAERFTANGFAEVRPAYGSILVPLFEEDGLRIGELARRARLSKQTMTALVRRMERDGLVERGVDDTDGRATLLFLTERAREFAPVAAQVLDELDAAVRASLSPQDRRALGRSLRVLMDLDAPK